jgi:hypothetical protein
VREGVAPDVVVDACRLEVVDEFAAKPEIWPLPPLPGFPLEPVDAGGMALVASVAVVEEKVADDCPRRGDRELGEKALKPLPALTCGFNAVAGWGVEVVPPPSEFCVD